MAALAGLALGGLGLAREAEAQARQVKVASIANANSPWHKAMIRFKEIVDAESGGRLQIQIYTDGQLGDINGMMSAMQLGTLEMAYYGLPSVIQLRGSEALNVMYVPYLFKNAEWAEKILNNDEFRAIYNRIAETAGVRVVGAWGQRSPRALQTTKGPITEPDQVKGMRLRIPPIEMLKLTFEKLGAQITPMGMLEIYNALARGTVEGQDNGFDLSIPGKFHEVAKFWSATDHAYELVAFFASERFWKSLSAEDRELIDRAGKQAGLVTTELTKQLDADGQNLLKAAGVTYVAANKDAFRAALADLHKASDGKLWPAGLVERIRKLQE
jgi:tripartite ATP-independent transporter DctP family solute receptor